MSGIETAGRVMLGMAVGITALGWVMTGSTVCG